MLQHFFLSLLMYMFMDGHRKPVYTDTLIPRGLIGNSGKILGCRALTLLHDDQGHPLLATCAGYMGYLFKKSLLDNDDYAFQAPFL